MIRILLCLVCLLPNVAFAQYTEIGETTVTYSVQESAVVPVSAGWRNLFGTQPTVDPSGGVLVDSNSFITAYAGTGADPFDYFTHAEVIYGWLGQPGLGTYPCPTDYLAVDTIFEMYIATGVDPVWQQYREIGRTTTGAPSHLLQPAPDCEVTVEATSPQVRIGGRLSMEVRPDALQLVSNREDQACAALESSPIQIAQHTAPAGSFTMDCLCQDNGINGNVKLECDNRVALRYIDAATFAAWYSGSFQDYTVPGMVDCVALDFAATATWWSEYRLGKYGGYMVGTRLGDFIGSPALKDKIQVSCLFVP